MRYEATIRAFDGTDETLQEILLDVLSSEITARVMIKKGHTTRVRITARQA